ncbi:MAG: FecR domain-containing protein [bacterium]|nr:FecR domain-containing protein [bacterium]
MKNILIYILSLFVFLLNTKTLLFAQPKSANAKIASTATITYIQGSAEVKKLGSKEWLPSKLKMLLHEKDKIRTRLASSVEIQFEDGSIVKIGENTVVGIEKLKINRKTLEQDFSIKLWLGKIMVRIEKLRQKNSRFRIITPTAIVGVRGTIFIVCVDENKRTKTVVEAGQVYFRGSKQSVDEEIILKCNEFSISSSDGTKITLPEKITPEELNKLKEGIKEIKSLKIDTNQESQESQQQELQQIKETTKNETSVSPVKQENIVSKETKKDTTLSLPSTSSPSGSLKVIFPNEGTSLTKNYSDFKGTSAPEHSITLSVTKGSSYTTNSDKNGDWNINQVYLPEGDCTINITATNQDNTINESTSLNLTVDTFTTKPKIILPSDGTTLNSICTNISGNAEPYSSINLTINNQQSLTTTADNMGNFYFNEITLCKPTAVKINYHFNNQNKFLNKIPKLFLNITTSPPNNTYNFKIIATDKFGNISEPANYKINVMIPITLSINDMQIQLFGPDYSYTYEAPYLELGNNDIKIAASYEKGISQQIIVTTPFYDNISPFILTKRRDLKEIDGEYFITIYRNIRDNDEGSGIYRVTANDVPMIKVGDDEYQVSYSSRKYFYNFPIKIRVEDWAGNIALEHLYIDWGQIKKEFNPDIPPHTPVN